MENIELNKYKEAWKTESDNIYRNKKLTDSEIMNFLKGKSKDISILFKSGLYIDIVLKFALTIGFIILIFFWKTKVETACISGGLMLISGVFGILQLRYLLKFPDFEIGEKNLRSIINSKINYYNNHYKKALYIGAASAPLFFLCGMLFYFYYKYGEIRAFQIDDFIVFGSAIIISYIIAIASQLLQFRFQMNQLKSSLQEIDEDTITELTLKKEKNRRIRLIIIMLLFIVVGILLFTYLLSS